MKTTLYIIALALASALSLPAKPPNEQGPNGERPPPHHKGTRAGQNETRMLQHFLAMDPEELTKLRQTIERIEQMSPEEKQTLRERIGKLEKMKPERVNALRERFNSIPEEQREAMRQRWLEMTPEERKTWRTKLRTMSQEERVELFETEGFLPSMGKHLRKNQGPPPANLK